MVLESEKSRRSEEIGGVLRIECEVGQVRQKM